MLIQLLRIGLVLCPDQTHSEARWSRSKPTLGWIIPNHYLNSLYSHRIWNRRIKSRICSWRICNNYKMPSRQYGPNSIWNISLLNLYHENIRITYQLKNNLPTTVIVLTPKNTFMCRLFIWTHFFVKTHTCNNKWLMTFSD